MSAALSEQPDWPLWQKLAEEADAMFDIEEYGIRTKILVDFICMGFDTGENFDDLLTCDFDDPPLFIAIREEHTLLMMTRDVVDLPDHVPPYSSATFFGHVGTSQRVNVYKFANEDDLVFFKLAWTDNARWQPFETFIPLLNAQSAIRDFHQLGTSGT